jgi:hypothetical protein
MHNNTVLLERTILADAVSPVQLHLWHVAAAGTQAIDQASQWCACGYNLAMYL